MTVVKHVWRVAAMAAEPALRLTLKVRARRGKELPERLHERHGIETHTRPEGPLLWIHAASVGEIVSILPVLQRLAHRADDLSVLVTTGTVTSARLLDHRLLELGLERRITHRFVPLDVPRWVNRFLDHWRPDAAAFVESELWPNLLTALKTRCVPTMLVNGRMSVRSYRAWRRMSAFARHLLSCFALIYARTELDAERFRELGAIHVFVPGDLKFAADPLPVDPIEFVHLNRLLKNRPVWLAASTHPGEEKSIARVHSELAPAFPGLLTVIIPRHPQRGAAIQAELGSSAAPRRGVGEKPPAGEGIWIADTLGELGLFYRLIPIVFVGRSLNPPGGGQNPLEPARLGCAIAVGPHTENFSEAVRVLIEADALTKIDTVADLATWVATMLCDPEKRERACQAGIDVATRYAGLPDRVAADLLALIVR